MKAIAASVLFIISVPYVIATTHTACYNYFLQKDGCVFSSASAKTRCPAPVKDHPAPVQAFKLQSGSNQKRSPALERRYDTTIPSFAIASGKGICGTYDSEKQIGVCLWSGAEQKNPTLESAGWLNGLKTSNCGKTVYVQRTGHPETVQYAKVLDGCSFDTTALDTGCFQIGLSIELFNKFNPSDDEKSRGKILGGLSWEFNNLQGQSPQQGPV